MKIQSKHLLFAILSVVIYGVTAGLLSKLTIMIPAEQFVVGFMIGVVGMGFFVWNAYKAILWKSRARRFKKAFGVNSPDFPDEDWKAMSAIQPIVDECLKVQAEVLQFVYQAEDRLLEKKPENLEQAMERAKKIMTQTASVESEKKIFWSKRNLAWEWGFEVWSSHKDYVSALDRAGKEKIKKQF